MEPSNNLINNENFLKVGGFAINLLVAVVGFFLVTWIGKLETTMEENSSHSIKVEKELVKLNDITIRTSEDISELKRQIGSTNDKIYELNEKKADLDKRVSLIEMQLKNN